MKSMKLNWIAGVLTFMHLVPAILCWGQHGHYATCKIAEEFLTEDAKAAVKGLLPESAKGELAAVCSWPDLSEIRKGYPWSSALHYTNTPNFVCKYDYCRDCHDSANQKNRCVIGAMYNYTIQLVSAYHNYGAQQKYNLTEALMFLSHFSGDIHQPLHVGFVGDQGGNLINVTWYNQSTNLHHVWDTAIIDSGLEKFYDSNLTIMIGALLSNITDDWSNEIKIWEKCNHTVCPIPYASESISLACKYAYKNATPGSHLDDEYFLSRLPIVEKRLAKGGIRLAATLNRIFDAQVTMENHKLSIL
ncbi:endonuclease 4-like [Chenopodium quinoa]|uniref:Aspergillus nuclease S1 n=1 Tax=Chenopodium quinoa TaxID=63459 RepID=A0A803LL93_CHEQI|nr:endonuclease 4-like [Chenopodium quinoa]